MPPSEKTLNCQQQSNSSFLHYIAKNWSHFKNVDNIGDSHLISESAD